MNLTGIVLAGGKSSRIGRDKALLEYGGMRLVERSISIIEPLCNDILISTNNPGLAYLGYPLIKDEHRGIGPIAGLHAALRYSWTAHNIVIPCDTPLVTVDVFERMFAIVNAAHPPACVAGTEDGYIEPLIGCYHRTALQILEEQISRHDFKLHNALTRMGARIEIFSDRRMFWNINTKADIFAMGEVSTLGGYDEDKCDVSDRAPRREGHAVSSGACSR
jgi:molybdopterin-guanine dinucleotide biosynthesis protein A